MFAIGVYYSAVVLVLPRSGFGLSVTVVIGLFTVSVGLAFGAGMFIYYMKSIYVRN
jgi:hypothetical protein